MDWETFSIPWLILWAVAVTAPFVANPRLARQVLAIFFPTVGVLLLAAQSSASPAQKLLASSFLLLIAFKASIVLSNSAVESRSLPIQDRILFFTIWPGMEPDCLKARATVTTSGVGRTFNKGLIGFLSGLASLTVISLSRPHLGETWTGVIGVAAFLTTIHFGLARMMHALLRLTNRPVERLFDEPFKSIRLLEFWSQRWNRPFVSMNKTLFLGPFTRLFGTRGAILATFVVSGLLHEIALSYPASGGWGGPLLYFTIQALLVLFERRLKIKSRWLVILAVLLPTPLLFHEPFRTQLIVPFFTWSHDILVSRPIEWYYGWGLWIMGALQLAVLLASFQVPKLLRWKEELAKLQPFNRKLMWVYGSFIVFTIIGFGVLTLCLHSSFLNGERSAIALAAFIALFWILRVATDALYFKSEDWPKGEKYVIGHAMLNTLFAFLILSYGGLVVWHFRAL